MTAYLYVLDTMADWEVAFLLAELVSGRYFRKGAPKARVIKVGRTLAPVVSMGGMAMLPETTTGEARLADDDLLILPGADSWLGDDHEEMLLLAKGRIAAGLPVAAICGATMGLAKVGALDSVGHTSNDLGFLKATCPRYAGEAYYRDEPAVADGNLVTASGVGAIEFAYEAMRLSGAYKDSTLEAWRSLYLTKEARYFYELTASMAD